MAIIRQRLPIPGPFDIRIGLPRDKGFDPDKARKEQKERRPNRNTTVNKFRSMVAGAEGFYRPAKFLVVLEFPKTFTNETLQGMEFLEYETDFQFLNQTKNNLRERLFFFCDAATLPERTVLDTSNSLYGPERNIARGLEFGTMNLTFMLDSELSERVVFESWQNLIVNNRTFNLNFYDEYTGRVLIYPLHENRNETTNEKVDGVSNYGSLANLTLSGYYCELVEAYPKTIAPIELSYGNKDQIARQQVTFNYRYWRSNANLRTNEDTQFEGDIDGVGEIKDARFRGPFGGIISKLPPEIRRAGRDVLNQIKTRFPIGRVFGGRVFPPFF